MIAQNTIVPDHFDGPMNVWLDGVLLRRVLWINVAEGVACGHQDDADGMLQEVLLEGVITTKRIPYRKRRFLNFRIRLKLALWAWVRKVFGERA